MKYPCLEHYLLIPSKSRQSRHYFLRGSPNHNAPVHTRSNNTEAPYSSMVLTHSHSPRRFSFHRVILLSAPEAARTFPLNDQLTRQTAVSNCSTFTFHCCGLAASLVQMRTVLSCDALAM